MVFILHIFLLLKRLSVCFISGKIKKTYNHSEKLPYINTRINNLKLKHFRAILTTYHNNHQPRHLATAGYAMIPTQQSNSWNVPTVLSPFDQIV